MERFTQDLTEAAFATAVLLLPSTLILIGWIGQLTCLHRRRMRSDARIPVLKEKK